MKPPLTDPLRIALLEFLYILNRARRLYERNVKYATPVDEDWDHLFAMVNEAMAHTRQLLDEDSSSRGTRAGLELYPDMFTDRSGGQRVGDALRARRSLSMRTSLASAAPRPPSPRPVH